MPPRPVEPRPGYTVVVLTLPTCDICTARGYSPVRKARYDFRTRQGSWANGCREHYNQYRLHTELGVGKAQRLLLPHEATPTEEVEATA